MSKWVNLDIRCSSHARTFWLSRDCLRSRAILLAINNLNPKMEESEYADAMDDIADQCRKCVLEHHPHLTNCEILFIGYDYNHAALAITVQHPSLPRVAMYEQFGQEWLRDPIHPQAASDG